MILGRGWGWGGNCSSSGPLTPPPLDILGHFVTSITAIGAIRRSHSILRRAIATFADRAIFHVRYQQLSSPEFAEIGSLTVLGSPLPATFYACPSVSLIRSTIQLWLSHRYD